MNRQLIGLAALAVACAVGQADANTITISKTNGSQSASAEFAFSNNGGQNQLELTLTNTMTSNSNPGWLCGLFFDIAGSPTLSAPTAASSMITLTGTTQNAYSDHTIDQFWAYRGDISGALSGQQYGLGAAGFGVFGPGDMITGGGPNPQPDGSDGGIIGNFAGVTVPPGHQGRPLALGSITFTFLLDSTFDVDNASVDNIAFVFGTSFSEIILNGEEPPIIPVPMAMPMAVAGLVGVVVARRRIVKN